VLKQYVTRDITNGKILTESGFITCPKEVAEHLSKRVGTDEWKRAHADKSIHEIVVSYSPHGEIKRPQLSCPNGAPPAQRPSEAPLGAARSQPVPAAPDRSSLLAARSWSLAPNPCPLAAAQVRRARMGSARRRQVELLLHDAR